MTRRTATRLLLPFAATLLLVCAASRSGLAADPVPVGPHGGALVQADTVRCEIVVTGRTIRVWLFDELGDPIDAADVRGTLTLQYADNPRRYHYPLYPERRKGSADNVLVSEALRSDRLDDEAVPRFALYGLSSRPRQSLTFAARFPNDTVRVQQAIAKQTVCPVSGRELTTRATLWNVPVASQSVFVCCESCIDEVQEQPQRYLTPSPAPSDDQAVLPGPVRR
ncbi:hypothetical protein Mal4_03140 [Maioricimonas rarisocia]|uniref:Uncharacterized protein n=1 Tax=Maioricimonas rarisocia TaxID=2528026 RepID=A0A517Z0M6_9PLAN|nr:hypothetical protein [Maioricimonas rarisocia]QDU36031.1 hypothetical protein Mal4_03140 [Maioricimonas rarisocia]